eukprot:1157884-Pelagomonas_calceolata.AAC.5
MSEAGTQELLNNIRLGAPASDLPLVQLVMSLGKGGMMLCGRACIGFCVWCSLPWGENAHCELKPGEPCAADVEAKHV